MWELVKIGEICQLKYGKALEKEYRLERGEIPAYGANGIKTFSTKALYSKKSIIIGRKGSAGELNKVSKPFWALDVTYYVIEDPIKINLDFLFYSFSFLNLPSMAKGVKPGINRNDIYEKKIMLPPLSEQKRIVNKLDGLYKEIDKLIAITNSDLLAITDLMKAYVENSYRGHFQNYKMTTVGESCEFYNGKPHEKEIDDNGEYVVINSKFISSDGISQKYTKKQLFPLIAGDVVLVMSDVPNGKALAKTFLVDCDEKYSLNQRICCIRSKNFHSRFLQSLLERNPYFLKYDNGENQTNLRKSNVIDCPVPIVTLDEQLGFIDEYEKNISTFIMIKQIYFNKLVNLEALKKSLLSQELKIPV